MNTARKKRIIHRGADLMGANLKKKNLQGANLRGAYLIAANLNGADLRGRISLEQIYEMQIFAGLILQIVFF